MLHTLILFIQLFQLSTVKKRISYLIMESQMIACWKFLIVFAYRPG